jgi:hypothetical protein
LSLRIQEQNLVIDTASARLPFGNGLGFEGAIAIAWSVDFQLAMLATNTLGSLAIAAVAAAIAAYLVFLITQVVI